MTARIERRQFLKVAGTAIPGLVSWSCGSSRQASLPGSRLWIDREERWVSSVCTQCGGGCGILARVVNGHVVKLDGNLHHPINRGTLCAEGQAGLQLLYHPDRFRSPMKRSGGRGSGHWTKIGWAEATDLVASHLVALRDRHQPESLVVLDGRPDELGQALLSRFCAAFGTPNYFPVHPPDLTVLASELMHGTAAPFGYDLEHSNYILSFGCDLLDGWRSPADANRALGSLRQDRAGVKARLVQIDRRFSTTAAKADEWVPVNALSEAALALAIAHVLIREKLCDGDFVRLNTFGFEDWTDSDGATHQGFKTLVLNEYRPEDVAAIAGVSVGHIVRIAREFAGHRPAVAISDIQVTSRRDGTATALAVHALNALVGSIGVPGGVSLSEKVPFTAMPELDPDPVAESGREKLRIDHRHAVQFPLGRNNIEAIPEAVLGSEPYPVRAVLIRNLDPVAFCRVPERFRQTLEAVPLVVSFSPFPDRSTEVADLILPDHNYLEKWLGVSVTSVGGSPVFSVAEPAIDPLYGTRQTEDVILGIAHRMGPPVSRAFPWREFRELLEFSCEGILDAEPRTGSTTPGDYKEFWKTILDSGSWRAAASTSPAQEFKTASRKFQFCPERLTDLKDSSVDRGSGLLLNLTGLGHADCPGPILPWVQEVTGDAEAGWWVEMHPDTAKGTGLKDGEWIWVETRRGKLRARARVTVEAMPGVLNVPAGHADLNGILDLEYDRLTGMPAWFSTRARIYSV